MKILTIKDGDQLMNMTREVLGSYSGVMATLQLHYLFTAYLHKELLDRDNRDQYDNQRVYDALQSVGNSQSGMQQAFSVAGEGNEYGQTGLDQVRNWICALELKQNTEKFTTALGFEKFVFMTDRNRHIAHSLAQYGYIITFD